MLGFVRLLLFIVSTAILIFVTVMLGVVLGTNIRRSMRMRRWWARIMVKLLGVKMDIRGEIPEQPGIIISNHRSYFDFVPLFNDLFAFPVGKIQINSWPLIGYGARQTGALFVDRENPNQRKTIVKAIKEKVKEGFFVINYAEGTTHKKPKTIDFKAGAFKLASEENFSIYPVAIDYKHIDDAWVDDDTFIRHFLECFNKWTTEVKVAYAPAKKGTQHQLLLQQTKNWIDDQLVLFQKEWSDS